MVDTAGSGATLCGRQYLAGVHPADPHFVSFPVPVYERCSNFVDMTPVRELEAVIRKEREQVTERLARYKTFPERMMAACAVYSTTDLTGNTEWSVRRYSLDAAFEDVTQLKLLGGVYGLFSAFGPPLNQDGAQSVSEYCWRRIDKGDIEVFKERDHTSREEFTRIRRWPLPPKSEVRYREVYYTYMRRAGKDRLTVPPVFPRPEDPGGYAKIPNMVAYFTHRRLRELADFFNILPADGR